jgi:hypothetical protein
LTSSDATFITRSGLVIARGYNRVVSSERGSYYEFEDDFILKNNISMPDAELWRLDNQFAFYHEFRTKDSEFVKLYHQQRLVDYADYKVGKWYVAVDDLLKKEETAMGWLGDFK